MMKAHAPILLSLPSNLFYCAAESEAENLMTTANGRTSDHPIHAIFLERWSPRAFTGEAMPEKELLTILEAARWAPSSGNAQPWRFLYARRGTAAFDTFLALLSETNRSWAHRASVLMVVVSKETLIPPGGDTEIPSPTHSFDAGSAWANLALQAKLLGWDTHGMIGFDRVAAIPALNVPPGYRVEAAVVIGRRDDPSVLPEALAAKEKPSGRKPLAEIALEGGFPPAG
jgi:nitroreductase